MYIRITHIAFCVVLGFGLISCNRDDDGHRSRESARQAGREAYRASQEVKQDAREAERNLRNAGKDFRDGWEEAKHEDPRHRDKDK
jgi:hypothetical protein